MLFKVPDTIWYSLVHSKAKEHGLQKYFYEFQRQGISDGVDVVVPRDEATPSEAREIIPTFSLFWWWNFNKGFPRPSPCTSLFDPS